MYHPKRLKLVNFMSHKESEFTFTKGVATMIYGVNVSDEETESNGAGKSAILEGISVALINSSLRKVSAKDLVTDGEKESIQELDLYNPVLDIELKIKRTIFSNTKSGKLEIKVNGEDPDVDITNVDEGNKFILSAIGVQREDLLSYFLISKEKYEPFLNISDTKKKAIISRFSQAVLIDPAFEEIDKDLDKISTAIEKLESDQKSIDSKVQVYQDEITNFSMSSIEEARDKKILRYREDIKAKGESIDKKRNEKGELECEIVSLEEEEEVLENRMSKFKEDNFDKEIAALRAINEGIDKEVLEEKKEYFGLVELESKIRKGLMDAVKCPKCTHEFSVADEKLNIKTAKERQSEIKEAIAESLEWTKAKELEKANNGLEVIEYESKLRKSGIAKRSLQRSIDEMSAKIDRKVDTIKRIGKDISIFNEDILSFEKAIKEVKEKEVEDKRSEYRNQIKSLEEEIEGIVKLSEIEISKKEESSLMKETFVKFKTYLSNKAIGSIEANANEYLEKTKTDLSIQMDGYKVNRTGKIKENISVTILRDGLPVGGGYGRLSSGEKVRIEISIIMSLQKLINSSAEYGKGLDLVWLDEIVESVDSTGIAGIMKSLNSTNQTIAVITHGTFNQVYPNTVTIIKEDGVSRIEQ